MRFIGTFAIIAFAWSDLGGLFFQNAVVAIGPGAMQLIVMPCFAISKAQVRLMDKIAPFDAQ